MLELSHIHRAIAFHTQQHNHVLTIKKVVARSGLKHNCHSAKKKDPLLLSGKLALKIKRQQAPKKSSFVCTHQIYCGNYENTILKL